MKAELTPQQRRFVELYAQGLSATQAALQSGYSRGSAASQGSRLLKNRKIREYLDTLQTEAAGDAVADVAEVQSVLSDLLRDPMKPPAARIGAANLLLKSRGAYVPPDEPLPNEKPEGATIVLPWTGREDDLPNAIRWRNGVVTPLRSSEDEDEQPPAFGAWVLQTLDPFDREQMEKLWEKMEGHTEHEAKTN